jgi:hypothetical protein
VRDGWFRIVSRTSRLWTSRYGDIADLRWLERVNDNWTISRALWRRAEAAWPARAGADPIEISRVYSLTILRKQRRKKHLRP